MALIHRVEKFFDVLMSFATIVGFISTAILVWTFLNTQPGPIQTGTTNVGFAGVSYSKETLIIQGVPFFWIFFSLVTLSAGHTYRAAKHIILTAVGKSYFPHAPHLMHHTQPTATPTAPMLRQAESDQ